MHMKRNLTDIEFLYPKELNLENFVQIPQEEPFSGKAIAYLHALSLRITRDPGIRNYPDVATFAIFCRKDNPVFKFVSQRLQLKMILVVVLALLIALVVIGGGVLGLLR